MQGFIYCCLLFSLMGCEPSSSANQQVAKKSTERVAQQPDSLPYALDKPQQTIILPSELQEVSGLTSIPKNDSLLVFVQDEIGTLYFYNIRKSQIEHECHFKIDGDFEALEAIGDSIYILRSKGKMYVMATKDALKNNNLIIESRVLPFPPDSNIEGLGYWPSLNMMVVAAKGDKDIATTRKIYGLFFPKNVLGNDPIFEISPEDYAQWIATAKNANGSSYKIKNADDSLFKFAPSGIAVHPQTEDLYILSSVGKWLLVVYKTSGVKQLIKLDKKLFPQPEGICFSSTGQLWISSEGKDALPPVLYRFEMQ